MKNIINIEMSKLFSKVSTYIILSINLGLVFLGLLTGTTGSLGTEILGTTAVLIFSAILINGIMSDVHNGTMKNIVGAGISRNKIFLSKIFSSIIATVVVIITRVVGISMVYLFTGSNFTLGLKELEAFLLVTVVVLLYTVLLVGINFMVSGALGSTLTILISIILPMISALTLIKNPVIQLIFGSEPTNLSTQIFNNGLSLQYSLQFLGATIVFCLITYISMLMFKKKEIK